VANLPHPSEELMSDGPIGPRCRGLKVGTDPEDHTDCYKAAAGEIYGAAQD